MDYINGKSLQNIKYENDPFPYTLIDNFLQSDKLVQILYYINNLKDNDADSKFINPRSDCEFNKYAFNKNYGDYLKNIFIELNSDIFIDYLEKLTGIEGLIRNNLDLAGAGIHRILKGGYLQLHTDFNTYNYGEPNGNLYINNEYNTYFGDPCINEYKILTLTYKDNNDNEFIKTFKENTEINIKNIKEIIRATYGTDLKKIDILEKIKNLMEKDNILMDRRINLLIYMNPEWKEEYKGSLCLCDKNNCVKKISPILNRCVIFNTSNKSIHGHPEPLNVPDHIRRQSIAVYYYTINTNKNFDFEGDKQHGTIFYRNIKIN